MQGTGFIIGFVLPGTCFINPGTGFMIPRHEFRTGCRKSGWGRKFRLGGKESQSWRGRREEGRKVRLGGAGKSDLESMKVSF